MPLSLADVALMTEQEYDDLVMRVGNLEAAKLKLEGENADLKRRVSALEGEPEPDPEPDPDPDPIPLPKVLTVGPGMGADFQSLEEIDSHALQAGTEIQVQYKNDIYKTKIGINKPGVKLIGQPGPNGERPILSGEGAKTHPTFPWPYEPIQSISMVCIGRPELSPGHPITIKGFEFQDLWEQNTYLDRFGKTLPYTGGAAAIRATAGTVIVEDCKFSRCIHGVFTKAQEGKVFLTLKDSEFVHCGNQSGSSDEAIYLESNSNDIEGIKVWNSRNLTTQPIHCRSDLTFIKRSWLEGGFLCLLCTSCEQPNIFVNGSLPNGRIFVDDSILINYESTETVGLRTDSNWSVAKRRIRFSNSAIIQGYGHPYKSFWCLNRASELGTTEYENMTFLSMGQSAEAIPTPMYFEIGKGVTVNFSGQNVAYLQAPLKELGVNWQTPESLTNFQPQGWRNLFAVNAGLSYEECVTKRKELEAHYQAKLLFEP